MDENAKLDDQLAALTDDLLAGREPAANSELDDLERVVKRIQGTIAPEKSPTPEYHDRLTQRLYLEWLRSNRGRKGSWRSRQLAYATLASVALLATLLAFTLSESGSRLLLGTAAGASNAAIIIVIVAALIAGVGIFLWRRSR